MVPPSKSPNPTRNPRVPTKVQEAPGAKSLGSSSTLPSFARS